MSKPDPFADISHPFLSTIQHYLDEGAIEEEFSRRARVRSLRREKGQEVIMGRGFGGHTPQLSKSGTLALARGIVEGRIVPSPMQLRDLGVQFGLYKGPLSDFMDEGGAYLKHCSEKAEGQLRRTYRYPEQETLKEALDAIAKQRSLSRRSVSVSKQGAHSAKLILLPSDGDYNTENIPATFRELYRKSVLHYKTSGQKLSQLTQFGLRVNPAGLLLTGEEFDEVSNDLRLNSDEQIRLLKALERTEHEISMMEDPDQQRQNGDAILKEFLKGSEGVYRDKDMAAYLTLIDLLHAQNIVLSNVRATIPGFFQSWQTLRNPDVGDGEWNEAFDHVIKTIERDPQASDITKLREQLFIENRTGAIQRNRSSIAGSVSYVRRLASEQQAEQGPEGAKR